MIFRKAVLFLAAAIATTTLAHAQLGVYGTITVNRLSGQQSSPLAPLNANPASCAGAAAPGCKVNDSVDPIGGSGGVYYDFKTLGPVRLGVDVRATVTDSKQGVYTISRGSGTRIYSTLGGVRASFHTPIKVIKPYIQFSAGLGRSDYGLALISSTSTQPGKIYTFNNLQYEGFAGVDLKLLPFMDFRVVELGYGALNSFGTNSHTYPIGTIGSGVVFHLPY
jgi:hypothetical protein